MPLQVVVITMLQLIYIVVDLIVSCRVSYIFVMVVWVRVVTVVYITIVEIGMYLLVLKSLFVIIIIGIVFTS